MAHDCEELRLGAVGPLGPVSRVNQGLFIDLLLADIAQIRDEQFSVALLGRGDAELDRKLLTGFAKRRQFNPACVENVRVP